MRARLFRTIGPVAVSVVTGCSLVTTPVKVAGSVVEHAIDAVSPFDDDPDPESASDADSVRRDAPGPFCSKCGAAAHPDARFCSNCGTKR